MVTALKRTALHVEDTDIWQEMIGGYLREAGYDVTQTDNLQDAEIHVQRQRFDVYVVDGSFPLSRGKSNIWDAGLQLYERIRQIHKDLNYIIVSDNPDLKNICDRTGIKFMNKNSIDLRNNLIGYLQSTQ